MTIKEMFIETISKALTSAEMISDAAQKSEAYASIASALARTGMVRGSEEVTATANDKEELKLENSKGKREKKNPESLKATVTNNPAKLEEVAETEQVEEVVQTEQAEEVTYAEIDDQDTIIPDSSEEAQEGVEDLQVWTEETQIQFAAEIEYVQQATDYIGKEETEECISLFTNGISNDIGFINPANIKGFVVYLECYIRERDAQ